MLYLIISRIITIISLSPLILFVGTVDPWVVEQRLDLYYTLLNATHYPPLFGNNNEGNLLWGLPLQMKWQNESGRLMVQSNGKILGKGWWGMWREAGEQ